MGWLDKILGAGIGSILEPIKGLADEFHLSGEEKNNFIAKMEALLQKRDSEIEQTIRAELAAKSKIIEAEMAQGDNFTKRARPTVVYVGLGVIVLNYCIAPIVANFSNTTLPELSLPTEFWVAWGGIVATWSVGRSAEKRGSRNKAVKSITGTSFIDLTE